MYEPIDLTGKSKAKNAKLHRSFEKKKNKTHKKLILKRRRLLHNDDVIIKLYVWQAPFSGT